MKYKRHILGLILIFILILVMLYSSFQYNKKEFDILYIFENYESNGNKIEFSGEIVDIDIKFKNITIRLSEPPYSLKKIKIENIEFKEYIPKKGDIVEILGKYDLDKNIIAEKILIYERWKYDLIFMRSLPAIPIALYLFFKVYRFNRKKFRFERRKKDA